MKKKIVRILGVSLTLVLLVSLALSAAVVADVSTPKVTVTPPSISAAAQYKIEFYTNLPLAVGKYIKIQFPAGTTLATSYTGETDVFIDGLINTGVQAGTVTVTTATREVSILVANAAIATADKVTVTFVTGGNEVKNPSVPGSYTLKVKTELETTYVESESYTLGVPGVVTRYNKDGNYVGSHMTIKEALASASAKDKLMIGPGTYTETLTGADGIDTADLTLEASGDIADTIVKANIGISAANAVLDGLTIKGVITATAAADDLTIQNCILEKQSKTSAESLVTIAGDRSEVKDCTIDTTLASQDDTGIVVAGGTSVTISGCTFVTDDGTGVAPMDKAIDATSGTAAVSKLTVKENTFTGTKGVGYYDHAATNAIGATVKDNTFDGYERALDVKNTATGSKLTVQNNSIINSSSKTKGAIDIEDTDCIIIVGNTIEDGDGYSVNVQSGATIANITVIGNNFINNGKGLKNNTANAELKAENNWWGDASGPSGEGTGSGDAVSLKVDYKPYLVTSVTTGQAAVGTTATGLDAEKTAGVKVSGLTAGATTVIWAAQYASNPKDVDPKYSALEGAWYDVYVKNATGTATLKLYADGITKDTDAYCWSGLENKYIACSTQGASASGGYVWVTISGTTTPSLTDLGELPFVLVAAPEAKPSTFSLTAPDAGADTALTNVGFTWASVAEAESYELVISANADMSSPMVKVSTAGTAYTYTGTLTDGTPYYWQVTALKDTAVKGKSDVGTFVAKAPVEPTPPVVIEPAPTPVIEPVIEIPPSPLTPGVIWAIIAIGAVLVIAVIVLIVRTRRVT